MTVKASRRPVTPRRSPWTTRSCAIVIVLAGLAAYSDSFHCPFVFDDYSAIKDNATIRRFPAWENFVPPPATPIARRPIVNCTLALNYAFGGPGVESFHAVNLLIHLLAALTLLGIVRRALLQYSTSFFPLRSSPESPESQAGTRPFDCAHQEGRYSAPEEGQYSAPEEVRYSAPVVERPSGIALAVALIWTVHPLLTESVTYLTQRTELLVGLFYLLTLYAVIRGASSEHPWRWHVAAVASCALGMGSKEVMATAPIVALLYDRCFLAGSFREALRRRWALYLGLAATWAILGALLIAYPWGGNTGAGFGLKQAGPWEYARTQPGVILNYLSLSFWPSSLCLDYGWPIAANVWRIVPPAVVLLVLLAGTAWALLRRPAFGFLGACFLLVLAPTSSIVPIVTEVAAERRMYLPLAAVIAAVTVAAYLLGRRLLPRGAVLGLSAALLAALVVALGARTYLRNRDYRTAISIWQDTVEKAPRNPRAWYNLAWLFASDGRHSEAVEDYTRAITRNPDYAEAYLNRGVSLICLHRREEAMSDLNRAIKINPNSSAAYSNRGHLLSEAGRFQEGVGDFTQAIKLKPDFAEAYIQRAIALARLNRPADALRDFDQAIVLKPGIADAYRNRAILYSDMKQFDKAMEDVRTCEKLGGTPDPAFVKRLVEAAAQAK